MRPAADDDEGEVRKLLSEAERSVVVPDFAEIRRRQTRRSRGTIVIASVLVVVVSVALGTGLCDVRETASGVAASASPTLTIVAGYASPTAQPTIAAPLSSSYGVIVDDTAPYLRSETDPKHLGALSGGPFNGAVSPDGRKIAYWGYSNGAPRVLSVLDPASRAQAQVLMTLPDAEAASTAVGGGVIWSTDGTGLLIAVNSRAFVQQPVVDAPYLYVALRQVDLAGGSSREIARKERAFPFFPIAWDRTRGVSAAVEWGPGGYATGYVALSEDGTTQSADLAGRTLPNLVRAAPDASLVLSLDFESSSAVVSVWPLTAPTQRVTLRPEAGERVVAAIWRTSSEIVVSIGRTADAGNAERLELWALDGRRQVVLRAPHRLDAVRPDGTAAITSAGVVDLTTGALAKMPEDANRVVASFVLTR
jgi:hypothetical protein